MDSLVCTAGVISKQNLIGTYGLTAAQADDFFKKPMTIHLNITVSTRYADDALTLFGLRLFGD